MRSPRPFQRPALAAAACFALAAAAAWSLRHSIPEVFVEPARRENSSKAVPARPKAAPAAATPAPREAAVPQPRGRLRMDTLKIADVPAVDAGADPVTAAPSYAAATTGLKPAAAYSAASAAFAAAPAPNGRTAAVAPAGKAAAIATPGTSSRPPAGTAKRSARSPEAVSANPAHAQEGKLQSHWSPEAAAVVAAARGLKLGGGSMETRAMTRTRLEDALMTQIENERRIDQGLRGAIEGLRAQGKPVNEETIRQAAGDVLASGGIADDPEAVKAATDRALADPHPQPPPDALRRSVKDTVAQAPDPKTAAGLLQLVDAGDPPKRPPPAKSALELYKKNCDVFERAKQQYGVDPSHIIGIMTVETGLGQNMGHLPVAPTLWAISQNRPATSAGRQAARDLVTLPQLDAQGDLGPHKIGQLRGSTSGAIGMGQFLPTSVQAFGRSADGKGRDPHDARNAIVSVANYLKAHGYKQNDSGAVYKSIFGYNHADWYVKKVLAASPQLPATCK